jgi:hypothetical protein
MFTPITVLTRPIPEWFTLLLPWSGWMFAVCKPTTRRRNDELINVRIGVGKRFCQAALKAEDGRLLDELRFENTSRSVEAGRIRWASPKPTSIREYERRGGITK